MKTIRRVRLSSLGDVLHTLPVAIDIGRALPSAAEVLDALTEVAPSLA